MPSCDISPPSYLTSNPELPVILDQCQSKWKAVRTCSSNNVLLLSSWLWHYQTSTHAALCLSQLHETPGQVYKMKSITTKRCSLHYTYRWNCSSTTKMKLTTIQQDGWPTINSPLKTATKLRPNWTRTKLSSCIVTGSGCSIGDHVTCNFADSCCHWQEIPASQSSCCYGTSSIDVTFFLPTSPIRVSRGCSPHSHVSGGEKYWWHGCFHIFIHSFIFHLQVKPKDVEMS